MSDPKQRSSNAPEDAATPDDPSAAETSETAEPSEMAEIDLLPAWYAALVRRRRRGRWQAGVTGLLVVVMGVVLILRQEDVAASQVRLRRLGDRRVETDKGLLELRREEKRLERLAERADVLSRIGLPVEVTRILADVESGLAPTTALESLSALTETGTPSPLDLALAKKRRAPPPGPTKVLRFSLTGVAARTQDVQQLYLALRDNPLFRRDETKLLNVKSDERGGRPVRSFQLSFAVDLLPDGGHDSDAEGNR